MTDKAYIPPKKKDLSYLLNGKRKPSVLPYLTIVRLDGIEPNEDLDTARKLFLAFGPTPQGLLAL